MSRRKPKQTDRRDLRERAKLRERRAADQDEPLVTPEHEPVWVDETT